MMNLMAAVNNLGEPLRGIGTPGLENTNADTSASIFERIISSVVGIISVIGIIWLIFLIITGAIGLMMAGGDKGAAEGARRKLFNGLIGFVVLIAAIFIVSVMGRLLGIPNILQFNELVNQVAIP